MLFVTLLDPRARIKGSRDPLGIQPIWTFFGRRIIKNLTTVTTSLRGFTVLLLSLYFAEQAMNEQGASEANFSDLFLKFEQLAAYSRVSWGREFRMQRDGYTENEVRGVLRVKRNLGESKGRVWISAQPKFQILSSQKTYGLWGLYTSAARSSALLDPATDRLSSEARNFVESNYLPHLRPSQNLILSFLRRDRYFEPRKRDASLGRTLAEILGPHVTPSEKEFYLAHLIASGRADSLQQTLWEHLKTLDQELLDQVGSTMVALRELIKRCEIHGDTGLAERLEHICQIESVLAPAGALFAFLLSRDGHTVQDIARMIRATWGPRLVHIHVQGFGSALSLGQSIFTDDEFVRWTNICEMLSAGHYEEAITLLLKQNESKMSDRGGTAWIQLKNDVLDVRFGEDAGDLPASHDLSDLWVNPYFIRSLDSVGWQIEGVPQDG